MEVNRLSVNSIFYFEKKQQQKTVNKQFYNIL